MTFKQVTAMYNTPRVGTALSTSLAVE